jgi:hypothetical protein
MSKCAAPLAIQEMSTKTTLRFHLTSVRMAIIKKTGVGAVVHMCYLSYLGGIDQKDHGLMPAQTKKKVNKAPFQQQAVYGGAHL